MAKKPCNKIIYVNKEVATRALHRLLKAGEPVNRVYRCGKHSGHSEVWHVTKQVGRRRQ